MWARVLGASQCRVLRVTNDAGRGDYQESKIAPPLKLLAYEQFGIGHNTMP